MPKIPQYFPDRDLPRPQATTGLGQVPIDLTSAPFKALGGLGEALGKLGEVVFSKAKEHEGQAVKRGVNSLMRDISSETTALETEYETAETSEEKINSVRAQFGIYSLRNILLKRKKVIPLIIIKKLHFR